MAIGSVSPSAVRYVNARLLFLAALDRCDH